MTFSCPAFLHRDISRVGNWFYDLSCCAQVSCLTCAMGGCTASGMAASAMVGAPIGEGAIIGAASIAGNVLGCLGASAATRACASAEPGPKAATGWRAMICCCMAGSSTALAGAIGSTTALGSLAYVVAAVAECMHLPTVSYAVYSYSASNPQRRVPLLVEPEADAQELQVVPPAISAPKP